MRGIKDKKTGRFVKNISSRKECITCSSPFIPRHEIQKFCDRKCMGIFYRSSLSQKVLVNCNYCNKPLAFSPSRVKFVKNIFCNSACYGDWISKNEIMKGERAHSWKGGITPVSKRVRSSKEYFKWREAVFKRDNYSCVLCGDNESGTLNADHIISFSKIMDDMKNLFGVDKILDQYSTYKPLWDITNGRTLCLDCHKLTPNYLKK